MYVSDSSPTLQSCQVLLNSASQCGGVWVASGTLRTGNTLYCGNGVNLAGDWADLGGNIFQGQCDPFCDGDVSGDRVVDGEDIAQLLSTWGLCSDLRPCYADFNENGEVDGADLSYVLSNWGRCSD